MKIYRGWQKYRVVIGDMSFIVTPQAVESNDQLLMVGKPAKILYEAIATQNKQVLKTLLPTLIQTATLLLS